MEPEEVMDLGCFDTAVRCAGWEWVKLRLEKEGGDIEMEMMDLDVSGNRKKEWVVWGDGCMAKDVSCYPH